MNRSFLFHIKVQQLSRNPLINYKTVTWASKNVTKCWFSPKGEIDLGFYRKILQKHLFPWLKGTLCRCQWRGKPEMETLLGFWKFCIQNLVKAPAKRSKLPLVAIFPIVKGILKGHKSQKDHINTLRWSRNWFLNTMLH